MPAGRHRATESRWHWAVIAVGVVLVLLGTVELGGIVWHLLARLL